MNSTNSPAREFKPKAYLSFDGEFDGPCPLTNSLLSIGIVLFDEYGTELDCMEVNIHKRDETKEDPDTMQWWEGQQAAWKYCHQNMRNPWEAMEMVANFYRKHMDNFSLRWVAAPACADWMFLKCYYEAFGPQGKPDIGFSCFCLSERKRALWDTKMLDNQKYDEHIKHWTKGCVYTHKAIDDARFQGKIYCGIKQLMKR